MCDGKLMLAFVVFFYGAYAGFSHSCRSSIMPLIMQALWSGLLHNVAFSQVVDFVVVILQVMTDNAHCGVYWLLWQVIDITGGSSLMQL